MWAQSSILHEIDLAGYPCMLELHIWAPTDRLSAVLWLSCPPWPISLVKVSRKAGGEGMILKNRTKQTTLA